jgi:hypothetical protein
MGCRALAAQLTLRHDILKGILPRAVQRASIASALKPPLCRLFGLAVGSGTSADGSVTHFEGDILLVLPRGIAIADVSVVHPHSTHLLQRAAMTAGAAASHRDQQKRTAYARLESNGYEFVPAFVESYGRLSQPAMKLLHTLGEEAAGPGGILRASFVEGALRELGVGLVRANYFLYQASVGMLARASGACFRPGLARPMDDACAD